MPGDPRLRVADADRERTAELLREHHAVGRLTREEFEDRLERAFAARTRGDLDELLADLPAIDLYRLPSSGIRPVRRRGSGPRRLADDSLLPAGHAAPWIAWAAGSALLVAAWAAVAVLAGGAAWIPWFLLVVVPWRLAVTRPRPLPGTIVGARASRAGNSTRGPGVVLVRVCETGTVDSAAARRLTFRHGTFRYGTGHVQPGISCGQPRH